MSGQGPSEVLATPAHSQHPPSLRQLPRWLCPLIKHLHPHPLLSARLSSLLPQSPPPGPAEPLGKNPSFPPGRNTRCLPVPSWPVLPIPKALALPSVGDCPATWIWPRGHPRRKLWAAGLPACSRPVHSPHPRRWRPLWGLSRPSLSSSSRGSSSALTRSQPTCSGCPTFPMSGSVWGASVLWGDVMIEGRGSVNMHMLPGAASSSVSLPSPSHPHTATQPRTTASENKYCESHPEEAVESLPCGHCQAPWEGVFPSLGTSFLSGISRACNKVLNICKTLIRKPKESKC